MIVKTTALIAETLDTLRDITPSAIYNYGRKWQREALTITSTEIDTAVFPEIPSLVSKLRKEVRDLAESLILSRLLLVIPRSYQEFRERAKHRHAFSQPRLKKPSATDNYPSQRRT